MKKRTRLLIIATLLLSVILIQPFSTLSISASETTDNAGIPYEYDIPSEIISDENVELYGHKERFYVAEESMNEIRILNEDGTVSAYMFDHPVKYIDDDGITKDKSNKLHESKRNNYLYVNDDNDIKTYFPKKITKKPIVIEAFGSSVEIGIVTNSKYSKKGVITEDNYVFYEQAFGENTAIRYRPDFNGYKEEIILYNENAPTSYSFEIKCDNMYIVKENGILNFISEYTDEILFTTDPFYIYDSSEDVNSYIESEYTVKKTDDNEYLLTVSLSEDYLSAEGLTYPVYIDPAVKYNTTSYVEDVGVYSNIPSSVQGADRYAYIGYDSNLLRCRFLIRFNGLTESGSIFNSLNTNKIVDAHLYLYNEPLGDYSSSIFLYQFNGNSNWTESGATWNNTGMEGYSFTGAMGSGRLSYTARQYIYFDITSIVEGWSNDNSLIQKGIIIKNAKEGANDTGYKRYIRTKNYGASGTPYLVINYTEIIPDGTYYIQNRRSKMYMETEGRTTTVGAAIQQNPFNSINPARWEIKRQYDGYYSIKSVVTGRYIGVQDASTADHAPIIQYQAYSGDETKWSFVQSSSENWVIAAKRGMDTNKVLSLPSSYETAAANLVQYSYTDDEQYRDEWCIMISKGTSSVGDLSYWKVVKYNEDSTISEANKVGCWLYNPKVYINLEDSSFSDDLYNYVSEAIDSWNLLLGSKVYLSLTSEENYADIIVNGVTESDFNAMDTNNINRNGTTTIYHEDSNIFYHAYYQNTPKYIQVLNSAEIHIPNKERSDDEMQATVTHEIGHALGFFEHSTNNGDLMYKNSVAQNISLNDVQHLSQVYGLLFNIMNWRE